MNKHTPTVIKPIVVGSLALCLLSACTRDDILSALPNSAPNYKQSHVGSSIEVPPDLSSANLGDKLTVSDYNPSAVANYTAYEQAHVQHNQKGFIEVLPTLYKVQVEQPSNQLPYILVDADASTVWQAVTRYWQYQGIRLKTSQPKIGIMETDWLTNVKDAPQTGIGGLLNSLIGFVTNDDSRDRYRLRFTRLNDHQTEVTVLYTSAEKEAAHAATPTGGKDPQGFNWTISDNDNPEYQLEMTRRIALYVSTELKRQDSINGTATPATDSTSTAAASSAAEKKTDSTGTSGVLTSLTTVSGVPGLAINGTYDQAWQILGIGLDKASFVVSESDYQSGTYKVRYAPQTDLSNHSFFDALWGTEDGPKVIHPEYLVRLARQGDHSVAVVQNTSGSAANPAQAEALLRTVQAAL